MLVGAGCLGGSQGTGEYVSPFEDGNVYTNTEFGFAFDYPREFDVHVRPDETRPYEYLGMDVDFFTSFRDIARDVKPTTIFFLYSVDKLSVDEFTATLDATDQTEENEVQIVSVEEVQFNDIEMTKIESTTALGTPKFHYLFDLDGTTIIVSIFLAETTAAQPTLETFRTIE